MFEDAPEFLLKVPLPFLHFRPMFLFVVTIVHWPIVDGCHGVLEDSPVYH